MLSTFAFNFNWRHYSMVSEGFDGDHELVVGGYSQVVHALRAGVAPVGRCTFTPS